MIRWILRCRARAQLDMGWLKSVGSLEDGTPLWIGESDTRHVVVMGGPHTPRALPAEQKQRAHIARELWRRRAGFG